MLKNAIYTLKDTRFLRPVIQGIFTIFCLYCGWQFYQFYLWTMGERATFIPRPAAVEAFLPISGLMALKKLLLTGNFDPIHPAALTIFMAILSMALLLRKGFCGWICPVGFASQLLARVGDWLGIRWKLLNWLTLPLMALKYLLLGFFVYIIIIKMSLPDLEAFSQSPYNLASDAKMLLFFLSPSTTTLVAMAILITISLFIRNFWCRFLCPYGALLGMLAVLSPIRIKRNTEKCIGCHKCNRICPAELAIASKKQIHGPECIGCGDCLAVCPEENCLTFNFPGNKTVPPLVLPLGLIIILFSFYGWAIASGHWHTEITLPVIKKYFSIAANLVHP